MNKLVQQGPLKGCGGAVGCRVSSRLISPELDTRNLSFEKCLVALHSKRGIKEDKKISSIFPKKANEVVEQWLPFRGDRVRIRAFLVHAAQRLLSDGFILITVFTLFHPLLFFYHHLAWEM